MLPGLFNTLVALGDKSGGFILILSGNDTVTSRKIRTPIPSKPTNFAIERYDFGHVGFIQFFGVGQKSARYLNRTHRTLHIVFHMPRKGKSLCCMTRIPLIKVPSFPRSISFCSCHIYTSSRIHSRGIGDDRSQLPRCRQPR